MQIYSGNTSEFYRLQNSSFDGVYLASGQSIDYFNLKNFPRTKIFKTKERIKMLPYSIYFRKHSCLVREVNNQIDKYTSNGLISNWYRRFTKTYNYRNDPTTPKKLAYDQISGIVTICVFMYAISCIVFVLELMTRNHERLKNIFDFLTWNR